MYASPNVELLPKSTDEENERDSPAHVHAHDRCVLCSVARRIDRQSTEISAPPKHTIVSDDRHMHTSTLRVTPKANNALEAVCQQQLGMRVRGKGTTDAACVLGAKTTLSTASCLSMFRNRVSSKFVRNCRY